ncbi:MAG: PA3496 family putative envelope integrity protein [Shewanella sp.]
MAHIIEVVPNDAELEAMTTPRNSKAAEVMQHRREIKKRLEDYLERAELKRALGDDDFF